MKKSFIARIAAMFVLLICFTGAAFAGPFDGTYKGKTRIKVDGLKTTVEITLTVDGDNLGLTVTEGADVLIYDVEAFIDNRGIFIGLLSSGGEMAAGFGGNI